MFCLVVERLQRPGVDVWDDAGMGGNGGRGGDETGRAGDDPHTLQPNSVSSVLTDFLAPKARLPSVSV
ncbi:hypothetical protein HanRHA438_Chr03g0114021 [Helianthus annuus]|nr:hypothetical protein HanIR_Chr03g0112501 [Helianthus annuus]KAJ0935004.1 hypothetical protein HanRHA438_Chr03g0114021 [Helianthus annuus]